MERTRDIGTKPAISINTDCSLYKVKCNTEEQLQVHFSSKKHKEAEKLLSKTSWSTNMKGANTEKTLITFENNENATPQDQNKRKSRKLHCSQDFFTKKKREKSRKNTSVASVLITTKINCKRKSEIHLSSIENVPLKKIKCENGVEIKLFESSKIGDHITQPTGTTYDKGGFTDCAHGNNYHQLLIIFLLLQLRKDGRNYKLGVEYSKAGKWDDLYLKYSIENGKCFRFFFQIKHGNSKDAKIYLNKILEEQDNLKLSDMITSLQKLLPDIKNPPVYSILYTNKSLHPLSISMEDCSEILKDITDFPELFLNFNKCKILKTNNIENITKLVQKTGLRHCEIENILKHILFITEQIGIKELELKVKEGIGEIFDTDKDECIDIFYSYILVKVQNWMSEISGSFIDKERFESIVINVIRGMQSYYIKR